MRAGRSGGRVMRALVVAVLGILFPAPLRAQDARKAETLSTQVYQLYQAGKYAEAIPLARRALTLREKALGPGHPDVGKTLDILAVLYDSLDRYGEAEPLYKRALAL
jgi:tetratricopeptide (TPR) repeat protein